MEQSRGIRISDADREHAAQRLHTAMAEGRITFAELDERLAVVYAARYADELAVPLADLPAAVPHPAAVVPTGQQAGALVLRSSVGDVRRKGEWQVPPALEVQSSLGDAVLDFTRAVCPHPVVEVRLKLGAGTAKVILPDGATADVDGVSTGLGSVKSKVPGTPRPGALHVRVVGKVSMGDVVVRYSYEVGRFRF